MMLRSEAPLRAACVAKPLRRLCALKRDGSSPAASHERLTINATTCAVMALAAMRPWRSIERKRVRLRDRNLTPTAVRAHRVVFGLDLKGMPTWQPASSGSVLLRRRSTRRPSATISISPNRQSRKVRPAEAAGNARQQRCTATEGDTGGCEPQVLWSDMGTSVTQNTAYAHLTRCTKAQVPVAGNAAAVASGQFSD